MRGLAGPFQTESRKVVTVSSLWIGFFASASLESSLAEELIGGVEQPGIAGFRLENRDQLTDSRMRLFVVVIGCRR